MRGGFRSVFRMPCAAMVMALPLCAMAATGETSGAKAQNKLFQMSLEELLNVEVISAGRKTQKLDEVAAAMAVISQDDIQRSGMTSLPELLRMVPGMQVAQIDASTWAVGSRGFNGRYSNKLLVLMDGRTLYTPTFSGVYWDAQHVMLEDIDRIEVIRGPGGTLWGANAVNGVINIISKPAAATQGGLVNLSRGNFDRQSAVRQGGTLGDLGYFRIHARNSGNKNFALASGVAAHDQRNISSAGFRAELGAGDGAMLTLQGDAYDGYSNHSGINVLPTPPLVAPTAFATTLKGGNLLLNWRRMSPAGSDWSLRFYYDTYQRRDPQSGERLNTYDLDFQNHIRLGGYHDVVWGGGWRKTYNHTDSLFMVSYTPPNLTDNVSNAFLQDDIAFAGEQVHLIAGAKLEHNAHTGFEIQPNLRLHWRMDERQAGWVAVSRAVHTPSRSERDIAINFSAFTTPSPPLFLPPPAPQATVVMRITGNAALASEKVLAYEVGYRVHPTDRTSLDAAIYYNRYSRLITSQSGTPFFEGTTMVMPWLFSNQGSGSSHGLELSGNWQATERWALKAGYAWMRMNVRPDSGSRDTRLILKNGETPRQQLQLGIDYVPASNHELGVTLYYVDGLPSVRQNIPPYTRLDTRWRWHPRHDLEVSVGAHNLLDNRHAEFIAPEGPDTSQMVRNIYGIMNLRF